MKHELKCWPVYFQAILGGAKTFDVRQGNDRQYKVGDEIMLSEWDPEASKYTGAWLTRYVTYVMHGPPFLPADVWVLGLRNYL